MQEVFSFYKTQCKGKVFEAVFKQIPNYVHADLYKTRNRYDGTPAPLALACKKLDMTNPCAVFEDVHFQIVVYYIRGFREIVQRLARAQACEDWKCAYDCRLAYLYFGHSWSFANKLSIRFLSFYTCA